jgi:hypothetical protein
MPTLEIGLIALVGLTLVGSIVGNVVQSRTVGRERAKNDILRLGLKQAKDQLDRAATPPLLDVDEQLSRL